MSGTITRYGRTFPLDSEPIEIEKYCFARTKNPDEKAHHFKEIVKFYWGAKNKKMHFVFHPWNEKMLYHACRHEYLSLSGCAASQKSSFSALWGLVCWMCNPEKTKVLATSTTLKDSRRRIWGYLANFFTSAGVDEDGKSLLPGNLASSFGIIRSVDSDGNVGSEISGIELIAGDSSKEKEAIGKLIGTHNENVILLCDEMPELSFALVEAAQSNLSVNPHFQMISSGNFKSIYDPFGVKATPKGGWGSVDENTDEWETHDGGYCLRFDGLKSPNVIEGEEKYPGLYSLKHLEKQKAELGENSSGFWRMCRSFPAQGADSDRLYCDADFIKGESFSTVKWLLPPTPVASLDPAFSNGGDKAIAYFGLFGDATNGKKTLQYTERKEYKDDMGEAAQGNNKSAQVAKQFIADCKKKNVQPRDAAYDSTGGGLPFGSLLSELWPSTEVYAVGFGGSASELPGSLKDGKPASELYVNRVAEIWGVGLDFVHSGQIKGLSKEAASELVERKRLDSVKSSSGGLKVKIETKSDMKKRTNKSPDDADAALILLTLCRERKGFRPIGMEGQSEKRKSTAKEKARKVNSIYSRVAYEEAA